MDRIGALPAQFEQFLAQALGEFGAARRVVVGDDNHLGAEQWDIGAPKAMHDADREYAVAAFQAAHARHEALHRLALRLEHIGHTAIED